MKSIYLRNFVATATMIAICILTLAVAVIGTGQGYYVSEYLSNMEYSAEEVAHTASSISEGESLQSWTLRMTASAIAKATGNHILITDENGVIDCCSDSAPLCGHLEKNIPTALLQQMKEANGESLQTRTILTGIFEEERIVIAVPITGGAAEETIGYVIESVERSNILSTWSTFFLVMLIIAAVIFSAILLFAFWYSKRMAKPLDEMAEASRMFARGDFTARIPQSGDSSDEMGALIESFNRMADSLENAEKRRSEFISNVSHELRTPMTTIAGFADGILDGTIPAEEQSKYLRSIRDETRRLARLVRSMLDSSRTASVAGEESRRTVFDLTELVLQTLLSFETRAVEKDLDVDPQLPDNRLMVRADKDGITQVIYNLLDNAVKFASPGSCITLRIYKEGEKAYVAVRDRGETIPPDDLPYIFDRFHKSDRSRSLDKDGVGLGLYLVKTIINRHDEDIAVKSENGETEFVFTLPLAEQA